MNNYMKIIASGLIFIFTFILYKKLKKSNTSNLNYISFKSDLLKPSRIIIVEDANTCDIVIKHLLEKITNYSVLGMDCEWVSSPKRKPISLLQLATSDGLCILIRLHLLPEMPPFLILLLKNPKIMKVGSAVTSDAEGLLKDYQLQVRGCVNIDRAAQITGSPRGSLKQMALEILDVSLNKSKWIQCSNWEIEQLSEEQINYAALDALIPVKILEKIILRRIGKTAITEQEAWKNFQVFWNGIIDDTRKVKRIPISNKVVDKLGKYKPSVERSISINGPLYENCFLQDPDGHTLCACNQKKLDWYLEKGLGTEVSQHPRIVKLNFRPKKFMRNEDSMYYTTVKENICVVCSSVTLLRRKNVVPYEYRTHFPHKFKDHKSHDVVLLCSFCHRESVFRDQQLRRDLSIECDAPIVQMGLSDVARKANKLKFSANALLKNKSKLSDERIKELENSISDSLGHTDITDEVLLSIGGISVPKNVSFQSHGEKVVKHFMDHKTLNELQFIWRSHFVNTMKPQFLPKLWSVRHDPWRDPSH